MYKAADFLPSRTAANAEGLTVNLLIIIIDTFNVKIIKYKGEIRQMYAKRNGIRTNLIAMEA